MPRPIIEIENVSKRYKLGEFNAGTMREEVEQFLQRFRKNRAAGSPLLAPKSSEFWALRNISFSVQPGEVIGIIGRNGAGKSTLLKILSRITEPTTGEIRLRGRVASLLEVGTGFHQELTGRENIYLNGAILGMTRAEVKAKFDEIVAFAEVETFLDTPVKRYSSGMYVRLAFAVAAHLEPDILIVDEVLAVGDYEFQQKCLGKMHNVASHEGRTVLLVSHNLAVIREIANRGLLLESGRIAVDGTVSDAISTYLSKGTDTAFYVRSPELKSSASHIARIEVATSDPNGVHRFGEPLEIKVWVQHDVPMSKACLTVNVYDEKQNAVFAALAHYPYFKFGNSRGSSLLVCKLPSVHLYVGKYHLRVHLSEPPGGQSYEMLDSICAFEVIRIDRNTPYAWQSGECAYFEEYAWEIEDTNHPE